MWLNENKIVGVPSSLALCGRLERLMLQNNDITALPHELGLLGLKEVSVMNNGKLDMIPKPMRGNSEIIIWILKENHENYVKALMIDESARSMSKLRGESKDGIEDSKKDIEKLEGKRQELLIERSQLYGYFIAQAFFKKACVIM